MCVIYTIRYACGDKDSVKDAANRCDKKCTRDNIRYDESLDENSTKNCLIYTYSISPAKTHSSFDSEVSDYPPEDP